LQVNVTLVSQEWKVYLDSVKRLDYDLARAAWIGDYNDPNSFLDMWLSNGGNNRTGWSDPEYDRLIAAAGRAADPGQRFEHFQEAEARLLAGMPVIPVYFYVRSLLIRPAVKGWYPNLLDHHPYKYVFLDESGDAGR